MVHVPEEEIVNGVLQRCLNLLEYGGEVLNKEIFHSILGTNSLFDRLFPSRPLNYTAEDSSPLGNFFFYGDSVLFILELHCSIELLGE